MEGDVMICAQRFLLKLQTLFRRNRSSQRLNEEIQFHLDQQIAENLAAGMSPREARYVAMRTFGNPTVLKEETRDAWGWTWLEQIPVWEHAAQDCGAAITSRISEPLAETDFGAEPSAVKNLAGALGSIAR